MRSGQYTSFSLSGKGLTVAGEEDVSIVSGPSEPLIIEATSSTQPVLLRNLSFGNFAGTEVHVTDAQGAVIFEDIDVPTEPIAFSVHAYVVQNSANVQFHRCTIGDPSTSPSVVSTPPPPARIDATDMRHPGFAEHDRRCARSAGRLWRHRHQLHGRSGHRAHT